MSPLVYSTIGFIVWALASRIQARRLERGEVAPHGGSADVQDGLAALGCLAPFCTNNATRTAWQVLCGAVLLPAPETSTQDAKG